VVKREPLTAQMKMPEFPVKPCLFATSTFDGADKVKLYGIACLAFSHAGYGIGGKPDFHRSVHAATHQINSHLGRGPLGLADKRLQVVHRDAKLLADLDCPKRRQNAFSFPTTYSRVTDAQLAGDRADPSEAVDEVR